MYNSKGTDNPCVGRQSGDDKSVTLNAMGAYARCWTCDSGFRPGWRNERFCSWECKEQRRRAVSSRGARTCFVCGRVLAADKRADSRYCSDKCKRRLYRRVRMDERFKDVRELVMDDIRQSKEAWRRLERASPVHYTDTPMAAVLRSEDQRVMAVFEGRAVRECASCGAVNRMRRGQRYCSSRCRVAAYRLRMRHV